MSPRLKHETLQERKGHILRAALTCFARKGYHPTTMDDIVEEAGLSKGGVYWHFGSKKELFLALFESVLSDLGSPLAAALEVRASAAEKLRMTLDAFAQMVLAADFQEFMPLLIDVWAQNRQDAEVNELAVQMYERFRRPLAQLIEQGIAAGEFKAVNAAAVAGILIALYDGLMVQWMMSAALVDWPAISETLTETLIAGLLTSAAGDSHSQDGENDG